MCISFNNIQYIIEYVCQLDDYFQCTEKKNYSVSEKLINCTTITSF